VSRKEKENTAREDEVLSTSNKRAKSSFRPHTTSILNMYFLKTFLYKIPN
jgi:hypothetical protein